MGDATGRNLGKCLVIGGAGMVGSAIAEKLRERGFSVRIMDLNNVDLPHKQESIVGDIRDRRSVDRACEGMNTVFQTAAVVWDPSLPASLYDDVNIKGNRQVIEACRTHGVSRLVYTSTVDVVLDGRRPIVNGDESLPYPKKIPADPYCRSKIIAEKDVIAANGTGKLHTCCIRPAGIYGPKDRYHLPAVIRLAGTRKNVRLGSGSARFSHVYVGNVAHAHILAAQHLGQNSPVSGSCYFITDHTPAENFFTFMEPFLERLGLPLPRKSIPYLVAYTLAWLNELIHPKSTFCRFAVVQTCVDRTFVHHRAAADFGYAPLFSKEEAFEKTMEWLKDRRDSIRV